MLRSACKFLFPASCGALFFLAGCIGPVERGSFDKTVSVSGPAQLELRNGSGQVFVRAGGDGQVRIHGDFSVWGMGFESARREASDLSERPPVEQQGNIVRVGYEIERFRRVSIEYTITVPAQTEARIDVGSGRIDLSGIAGPADLRSGSGSVRAAQIGDRVEARTGSGAIEMNDIKGETTAIAGSGSISFSRGSGGVSAQTGSGRVTIDHPGGRVTIRAGSGSIDLEDASADTRASTGSGRLRVTGNPAAGAFWDLDTRSGGVTLEVPSSASFRIYAHTGGGSIHTEIPITVQEETSRRSVRGRIGNGDARVEIGTGSGSITIR